MKSVLIILLLMAASSVSLATPTLNDVVIRRDYSTFPNHYEFPGYRTGSDYAGIKWHQVLVSSNCKDSIFVRENAQNQPELVLCAIRGHRASAVVIAEVVARDTSDEYGDAVVFWTLKFSTHATLINISEPPRVQYLLRVR